MFHKTQLVHADDALPGRSKSIQVSGKHSVCHVNYLPPYSPSYELAYFGMGCFWGAERLFWQLGGVKSTAVGYAGGFTPNPTYDEVCSGQTAHAEVVLVLFDPSAISYADLLTQFFEQHDPTQGMRQGNDVGTQYRSIILTSSASQAELAEQGLNSYQLALKASNRGAISTSIEPLETFYFAEEYHQQYLAKHPHGYCGLGSNGVCMPPDTFNTSPKIEM